MCEFATIASLLTAGAGVASTVQTNKARKDQAARAQATADREKTESDLAARDERTSLFGERTKTRSSYRAQNPALFRPKSFFS